MLQETMPIASAAQSLGLHALQQGIHIHHKLQREGAQDNEVRVKKMFIPKGGTKRKTFCSSLRTVQSTLIQSWL